MSEHIKEIDSEHFKDCSTRGATTIKVITTQRVREAIDKCEKESNDAFLSSIPMLLKKELGL